MSYDFFSTSVLVGHSSLFISSFLRFVPVNHLYLDRLSPADGLSSNLEVDHRKWKPCENEFIFQWVLPVFPFLNPHAMLLFFCFTLSISLSFLFNSPSLYRQYIFKSPFIGLQECLYLSHIHIWLILFHVISWRFVLTWLLSLSLSRREIIWRTFVHGTGFLRIWWCGCVRARC